MLPKEVAHQLHCGPPPENTYVYTKTIVWGAPDVVGSDIPTKLTTADFAELNVWLNKPTLTITPIQVIGFYVLFSELTIFFVAHGALLGAYWRFEQKAPQAELRPAKVLEGLLEGDFSTDTGA